MNKLAAVLLVLGCAGLAALPASCFVHRVSEDFACQVNRDCADGRVCDQGFCIEAASLCPSPCTSCDVDARFCRIDCTAGRPCGNLQCPAGYDCEIRCNNSGACGAIDCAAAASCDIDCAGPASCGNLHCGAGECAIRCQGTGACPSVDCAASCACDVACNQPAWCPSMACPTTVLGPCTQEGSAGAPCDSTEPGCGLCF